MKNYIIIEWKVNQLANRMLCLAIDANQWQVDVWPQGLQNPEINYVNI